MRGKKRNNEMDRKISIISFRTTDEEEGKKKVIMRWIERFGLLVLEQRMKMRGKKRNNDMIRKTWIISFRTRDESEGKKKK